MITKYAGYVAWLSLARHGVAFAAVAAAVELVLHRRLEPLAWGVLTATAFGGGVALSGLWALYFTERSRGRFARHAALAGWSLLALYALGTGAGIQERAKERSVPASDHKPFQDIANEKLQRVRALPEMAGLSDEAIALKLHSEYPEVPIEKIANDLGIPLSPSLQRAASSQR